METNTEIEKLRRQRDDLLLLLGEIETALLASGWREDYITRKIKAAVKGESKP